MPLNSCAYIDLYYFNLSSVGRTETVLQSQIREPAQAPVLAELRQSISSSLDALNQKIETVQSVCSMTMYSFGARPDAPGP